jgi:protein AaeX
LGQASARSRAVSLRYRIKLSVELVLHIEPACATMSFTEINLLGVYVAPISLIMVATWVIVVGLRRIAAHFGLLRHVWHPPLFVFAVYMIVLSSVVLIIAR